MPLTFALHIAERRWDGNAFDATVTVPSAHNHYVRLSPLTADEETQVRWYFSDWLTSQFGDSGRARQTEEMMRRRGEQLFAELFGGTAGATSWSQCIEAGDARIEISGTPRFQTLPWEWLWNPAMNYPVALDIPIVRTLAGGASVDTRTTGTSLNVLVVRSRSLRTLDVDAAVVARPLLMLARDLDKPIVVHVLRPATVVALREHLAGVDQRTDGERYAVIHFDVHGSSGVDAPDRGGEHSQASATLRFDDKAVTSGEIAEILGRHGCPLVVFTSCESARHTGGGSLSTIASDLLAAGLPAVIGMRESFSSTAVELWVATFYGALSSGEDVTRAMTLARRMLFERAERTTVLTEARSISDWRVPVAYLRNMPRFELAGRIDVTRRRMLHRISAREHPIGRDLDAFRVEHLLGAGHRVVLVWAGPGVGRTSFLRFLGWFWQATGLVEGVTELGTSGQSYTCDDVERALKNAEGRHVLLLDDIDLLPEERLAALLTEATNSRERVVVAATRHSWNPSRRWVAHYRLPPVDLIDMSDWLTSASARAKAEQQLPSFEALSDMLEGLPLAIVNCLPRLDHVGSDGTFAEVESGDVDIDLPGSGYGSHTIRESMHRAASALSPAARTDMLYLAPFGSRVSMILLDEYARRLGARAVSFTERLAASLGEFHLTGLIIVEAESDLPCLWINPLLPLYARRCLRDSALAETKATVENAFVEACGVAAHHLVVAAAGTGEANQRGRRLCEVDRLAFRYALRIVTDPVAPLYALYSAAATGFSRVGRPREVIRIGEGLLRRVAEIGAGPTAVKPIVEDLAERHRAEGNAKRAQELLVALGPPLNGRAHEAMSPDALMDAANAALEEGHLDDAELLARRALRAFGAEPGLDIAFHWLLLANILIRLGRFDEAEVYARDALDRFGNEDGAPRAHCHHALGECFSRTARHVEAIEPFREAIAIYRWLGEDDAAARSLARLAKAQHACGNLREAETNLQEALRLAMPSQLGPLVASLHFDYGTLLSEMGRPHDAADQLTLAVQRGLALGDEPLVSIARERLVVALIELRNFNAASEILDCEEARIRRSGRLESLETCLRNQETLLWALGNDCLESHDFEGAIRWFERRERVSLELSHPGAAHASALQQIIALLGARDVPRAYEIARRVVSTAREAGDLVALASGLFLQGILALNLNRQAEGESLCWESKKLMDQHDLIDARKQIAAVLQAIQ